MSEKQILQYDENVTLSIQSWQYLCPRQKDVLNPQAEGNPVRVERVLKCPECGHVRALETLKCLKCDQLFEGDWSQPYVTILARMIDKHYREVHGEDNCHATHVIKGLQ